MSGGVLGWLAGAVVLATGIVWFRLVKAVRIPRARAPYIALMGVGVALGLAAVVQGPGIWGGLAAWFAILAGGMFVALRAQSGQAKTPPSVKLGGPILDFVAADDQGNPFQLASLSGRPFLLKFFRGHW